MCRGVHHVQCLENMIQAAVQTKRDKKTVGEMLSAQYSHYLKLRLLENMGKFWLVYASLSQYVVKISSY